MMMEKKKLEHSVHWGELVVPRVWSYNFHHDLNRLESLFFDLEWEPGKIHRCKDMRDPLSIDEYPELAEILPADDVEGFYAWKEYDDALEYAIDTETYLNYQKIMVIGWIEMFGNVYEHAKAYRGEYATVRNLVTIFPNTVKFRPILRKLKLLYDRA